MEKNIKRKSKLSAELLQGLKRQVIMRYPRMHRGCLTWLHLKEQSV